MLTAIGIQSYTVVEDAGIMLYVGTTDAGEAIRQLAAYDEEEVRRVRTRPRTKFLVPKPEGPLAFIAVMLFFFAASEAAVWDAGWLVKGAAQAGLIMKGEWWRTVTALFLHADGGHLLGNLGMGVVVGLLVAQLLGSGVAWLFILISGIVGNALNAALQLPSHTAIGASTAVFGGIGLLAGFTQMSSSAPWHKGARRWAPAGAGLALLVLMGTAGERTDVWAHVTGFVTGGLMGLVFGRYGAGVVARPAVQAACGLAIFAVIGAAWTLALRT
ncbi:rhomboid family intramembrane serine protease [Emcibacter sp. SYSU 3D8]|uniref:rhomboid family intramembrane serine protease n=1 Tax=Emcibacter sp. SYSU 3D8 TaxID=3133969 RepID=UPI0031FED259